ncbi:MAG: winged helix-turn-helix transcriptional regulator [Candidatus Melainabacteria bacterium]|nr:winged helix-turn-helix transcriptional regulator [Candidatus Melainabacteria bacterium]
MQVEDSLSQTFAALADPTRRAMLAQLKHGECSVSDLAKPYEMSLPAITKHIKILERAGLVSKTKDAQWRPCKLKQDGLKEVADWVEEYRVYWEESFDRLEAYLQTVTEKDRKESKKHGRKKQTEIE